MALMIWVLTGIQDMSCALTLINIIWTVPVSSATTFSLNDKDKYKFTEITCVRKLSTISVQLARLIIDTALLIGGAKFLIYTISLSDLILNAMVSLF